MSWLLNSSLQIQTPLVALRWGKSHSWDSASTIQEMLWMRIPWFYSWFRRSLGTWIIIIQFNYTSLKFSFDGFPLFLHLTTTFLLLPQNLLEVSAKLVEPTLFHILLSTGPDCGDPIYSSSKCNTTIGQLYFRTLNNTSYVVTSTNPETHIFVIKLEDVHECSAKIKDSYLDPSLPFSFTNNNTILLLNCSMPVVPSTLNCTTSGPCH